MCRYISARKHKREVKRGKRDIREEGKDKETRLIINIVAGEILQTEENFISRLELLKKLYIIPLQTDRIVSLSWPHFIFSPFLLLFDCI